MIRRARAKDVAAIRLIAEKAYHRYVADLGRPPAPMVADFAMHIAVDQVFVIERNGRVAGYAVLILKERALLDNIAVDPACQGLGIGQALLLHVEDHVAVAGFASLDLYTNAVMVENLRWYRSRGFVATRRVVEHGFKRIYMRKTLVPNN